MKKQFGITLLEMLFAVAIGAILLTVGVPSFMNTIRNSEMTAATNAMVAALHAGRSEAVKRRARVTVCRSDNSGANPVCDANGADLAVFVNTADDNTLDAADTLVLANKWVTDKITINPGAIPNYVTFTAAGFTRAVGGGAITGDMLLCDPRGNDGARIISISPTGRPLVRHQGDVPAAPSCS